MIYDLMTASQPSDAWCYMHNETKRNKAKWVLCGYATIHRSGVMAAINIISGTFKYQPDHVSLRPIDKPTCELKKEANHTYIGHI